MREQFEAWYFGRFTREPMPDGYESGIAWNAWQARAAPALPQGAEAWAASGKDYDRNIHSNPDAKAWADFFMETFPNCGADHGTMLGWFANAMMAMHDHLLSGMAIVPVEPTLEMVDAAEQVDWSKSDTKASVINMWQAMLAATKEAIKCTGCGWVGTKSEYEAQIIGGRFLACCPESSVLAAAKEKGE